MHNCQHGTSDDIVAAKFTREDIAGARDERGETVLMKAAKNVSTSCLEYLLNMFTRQLLNKTDCEKRTALHIAVLDNKLENVKLLLSSKNNWMNTKDKYSNNALHFAILNQSEGIISSLLEAGTDYDAVNMKNESPLGMAIEKWKTGGNMSIVKLFLLSKKCSNNHIMRTVCEIGTVRNALLIERAPVGSLTVPWVVFLEMSLMMGNVEIAEHLIDKGISLNATILFSKRIPLVTCILFEIPLFEKMICNGAFDLIDGNGLNSILAAISVRDHETLSKLLELKFEINTSELFALRLCVRKNSAACFDKLLSFGVAILENGLEEIERNEVNLVFQNKIEAAGFEIIVENKSDDFSLKTICRRKIRNTFNFRKHNAFYCTKELNLPHFLANFILFHETIDF